ncbi:MAG TPA: hypothetical protein VJ579_02320 [Candidatus Paceibacterota bacterium]|nr:hypothetical protein [Candidatus Paceibacterota bacterium]
MCVCEKYPEVLLSVQSVQKLARADGLRNASIVRRVLIDDRPVVLVQAWNKYNQKVHLLLCPGDVCYRKELQVLPSGEKVLTRIIEDTYKCQRKEELRKQIRTEVEAAYRKGKLSYDPVRLIMNMFERVSAGEYLGEFSPGIIYVQEVAEMLNRIFLSKPGILGAKSFCSFKERKKRFANDRPPFFLSLGFPLEKIMGKLRVDNSLAYAPLTNEECRTAAFFEDTLALIERLVEQKKLGLHGMILCAPYPEETPDQERILLEENHSALLYARVEGMHVFQVQRHYNPEFASLCVFRQQGETRAKIVAVKKVHLSFGAIFGPDVSDVEYWSECFSYFLLHGRLK